MKDSGIKWIGQIPEEWGIKKLSQSFSEHKLKNLGNIEQNLLSLSYGKIVRKSIKSSVGLLPESFETYNIIDSNDIVLRLTDLQNDKRSLRTGLANERGIITSAYLTIRLIDGNDSAKYYHYLLHSYDKCKVFYNFGGGVRQGGTWDDLSVLKMIAPPKDEQTKIADFLDKKVAQLDEVKSLLEEQIKTLEDYRRSLIYETVTKGLDKTVPLKDSGVEWIGQIPEGWEVGRLKDFVKFQTGTTPPQSVGVNQDESGIPWFKPGDFSDNSIDLLSSENHITHEVVMQYNLSVYPKKTILLVGIASIGKVGYSAQPSYSNQQITALRTIGEIYPRYLAYLMFSSGRFIKETALYTVVPIINNQYLATMRLVLPSENEQKIIVEYLDRKLEQINQMIAIKKEQIENINKQRQTLIYDYVTGKRRI